MPLHIVHLNTDLVSGPVMVEVRSSLPVQRVSLILGNYLAGERVMANPCVSFSPQTSAVPEEIELQVPGIFPACAVTRAMPQKRKEDKTNLTCDGTSNKEKEPAQN